MLSSTSKPSKRKWNNRGDENKDEDLQGTVPPKRFCVSFNNSLSKQSEEGSTTRSKRKWSYLEETEDKENQSPLSVKRLRASQDKVLAAEVEKEEEEEEEKEETGEKEEFSRLPGTGKSDDEKEEEEFSRFSRAVERNEEEEPQHESDETDKEKMADLLDSFDTLRVSRPKLGNLLQDAACLGVLETIQFLLTKHFDEVENYIGWSIGMAAEKGHIDIVTYLLDHHKNDIAPGQIKWAAYKAAENNHMDVVDLLDNYQPRMSFSK